MGFAILGGLIGTLVAIGMGVVPLKAAIGGFCAIGISATVKFIFEARNDR